MAEATNAAESVSVFSGRPWIARSRDHVFYSAMAWAIGAAMFYGFATTYYLKEFFGTPPLPRIVHVHAVIFTAWVAFFILQASLPGSGRTALHRKTGIAGAALAVAMIVSGFLTAVAVARLGHSDGALSQDPVESLVINLLSLPVFLVFLVTALCYTRRPEVHKRLMLLAQIALLGAAVGRWPIFEGKPAAAPGLVLMAFALAGPLYDLVSRRRVHPVYVWGVGFHLLMSPPLRFVLARTDLVHGIAVRLIR